MAAPSTTYAPRCPARTALYRIVRDHVETFRVQAACLREGEGLPRFVEQEFRNFLQCGSLAGGFARFRCGDCGLDRLVPFSCKGRALCPSCGGRRMADRAAHFVDHVFPDVPVRQWVLSLPYRIRYQLAWNHDACCGVVAVFVGAMLGFLRARARDGGVADGRGGVVAVIQRFGGALNLNVHVHALVLDGVFAKDGSGVVGFHAGPRLTALDVAEVLATVEPRIKRLLARRGLGEGDGEGGAPDAWAEEARLSIAMFIAAVMSGIPALNGPGYLEAATSASTVPVAPSVLATVMRSESGLGLLVLWRGSPGWWSRSPGHDGASYSGGASVFRATLRYGSINLDLSYDTATHIVRINDEPIALRADSNALLIDDVDSQQGPRLVSQLPLDLGGTNVDPKFGSLGPLFHRSTDIVSFLRCDVGEMTPAISSMACGSLKK